ncbi:MAG: flippase-like domain-containing protein [Chloroflexota bacterium]|nr:flippase-like domain-containing protein [Chloroflexota bacterium]
MKRILFLLVGLIISVISLYFAFRGFDWGGVWDAVGRMRLLFFLLMLVPYVLTFLTKVWRWRVLFHPDEKRARLGTLFSALMISYLPLPFRAGEVARGMVASSRLGFPVPRVFSTILVEKVLDVLTLLLLLGISLPFVGLPPNLQSSALVLGLAVLAGSLFLLALVLRPELARKLAGMVAARLPLRFAPRIAAATDQALEGLAPLASAPVAARLGLWSIATWGINSLTAYLLLLALNLEVSPMAAVVLVVATNLSMAVPSAPGYIGTFELAVVAVLGVMGQPGEAIRTFALVYHVIGLAPVALIGLIAALQQGVGLTNAGRGPQSNEASATPHPAGPWTPPGPGAQHSATRNKR